MLQVDSGVYIGSVDDLNDRQMLADASVSHILSLDSVDPGPMLPADGSFVTKWIDVLDDPTSDLLSHMDACFMFIDEAVKGGGAALVHCQVGRSRSATIVTAYLMKRHQLGFTEAYDRLKSVKRDVQVNSGFEDQLRLYEAMKCEVDTSNPSYKQYRLLKIKIKKFSELKRGAAELPKEIFALDPDLSSSSEVSYRCRKCRRTLFRGSSILSHPVGEGASAFSHKKFSNLTGNAQCTSYFIEPVQWMKPSLLRVMHGQLLCPKCSSKLGSFSWCGYQCSCGRWVTPAFQLHHNRVDEIRQIKMQK
ncbi:dual specificity protein phosphatase 12 [Nothobranchius furzeri]|uniref:Dual specificity protein phosphatase 12 n=1 Tax=Nothobranchius furzeri TaxID=105023 RepID=A0A9D3BVJ3_NOTFU|nr:dual specificity protein phosphatase 12 [Nothobranchius furzeri]XP_054594793.1 dual specificity protein phosphatase 12 [Nothobranchius furzeri]XP_054594815.1 dual specificity protein phosphatase 12 [Nothobranchius furzeri]KAF7222821.1 dual specificity phosphatase 12 [Nothobranchius furzeri]